MKITAIRLMRMRLPLDPPFYAAWDPLPRRHFDATLVRVETDEGITGYGSGDTMDGFEPFESLFTGHDPLTIAEHVKTIESVGFHAGRYWPLEAALWDIVGQVTGQPVSVLFGGPYVEFPYDPPGWTPERRDFFLTEPVRIGWPTSPSPSASATPTRTPDATPRPPSRPSPRCASRSG